VGHVERLAQHRARLGAAPRRAHQHAELGQRPRALEGDAGALQALHPLAQQRLAVGPAGDRAGRPQRDPERALAAERARELDLLERQAQALLARA
jgi:hypothetical protein